MQLKTLRRKRKKTRMNDKMQLIQKIRKMEKQAENLDNNGLLYKIYFVGDLLELYRKLFEIEHNRVKNNDG